MSLSDFLGIVTPKEIEQLRQSAKDGLRHPVAALALAEETDQVATNTKNAAGDIQRVNYQWLSSPKFKSRLINALNFTEASSALGEIRAYGALLETAMAVKPAPRVPGKKVVPEFEVDAGDGAVIVEVHSRQLDPNQAQAIAENQKQHRAEHKIAVEEARKKGEAGVVTSSAIGVIPLGAPVRGKAGDSVLTNAISRICNIKQDEKQVDPSKPFVLWLDLQDPTVWGTSMSEQQFAPIYSEFKDGEVGTGALWFALYGRKDDPMIEMQGCDYHQISMLHNGRFTLSAKISAVVYSLPRAAILMEHPDPAMRLPPHFRASLLKVPFSDSISQYVSGCRDWLRPISTSNARWLHQPPRLLSHSIHDRISWPPMWLSMCAFRIPLIPNSIKHIIALKQRGMGHGFRADSGSQENPDAGQYGDLADMPPEVE